MYRIFIGIIFVALFASACKTPGAAGNLKRKSAKNLVKEMKSGHLEVDWYAAKARINYDDGANSIGFSGNIRMKKDAFIWMNATKFGFEAARILIRPDSIFVLNRLERTYIANSLEYIEKQYQVPADFTVIQHILLGNPVLYKDKKWKASQEEDRYRLDAVDDSYKNTYWLDGDLLLKKMRLNQIVQDQLVELAYGDYQKTEDKLLPESVFIQATGPQKEIYDIKINYTKIVLNEVQKTPFEIPKGYSKMD